ncbi:type I secretion system permease/ATPase [Sphingobium sp. Cam5-1]|uniref:type I secretion system permease/ATPase n=1 Tax=Sphingobium sp. Cam5-1 TaxID=2789327 RepID=UPI0018AD2B28|nr:type I secretion system permease/ATPase [Sphingobium sp. Cam5-1]QPI73401.1 type I secretion system permease/ATPase [Sphingobium sp. Cam5-1]QPI75542.1 type I secretion system permease/ATPase [Sphingobium sp. Cam5-1]QPI75713.1 type I secretion system permease/ATPase [Sphingobium sp. Cam5-1]
MMDRGFAGASTGADSGVCALATLLAVHKIAVDPQQLRHELGHHDPLTAEDILRLAKRQDGVRARSTRIDFNRLARQALPVLANGAEGWFLIGRASDAEALIQRPGSNVERLSREELDAIWSGEIVLLTTRESVGGAAGRFDIRWFIPQVVRYRKLIGEVLLITLALNLLGLAAPLFFQNVIDKVLVHNTLATLEVLSVGFVAVSLWEVAFGWLRTRLYSETSQKLDVELGSKLFRHMLGLPLSYFEGRRVGDTVTRIRQLESIREFLTNASLSVLIDPVFTIVFLVAMWIYSPTLFWIVAATIPAYVAVSLLVTGPLRHRLDEKFERGSANNALLVESVSGMQTIKASAVEPQWQERWERQLAGYSAANQRVINLGNTGSQAVQLISKLSLAAILFFGAREVIAGAMTVGALVAFNMFAQRVSGPVIRMAQLWQDFQQVRLSIDRLGDVLNQPVEPGAGSRVALPEIKGMIRFEGVKFRYGLDGPWTLEDIDIHLPAGGTLGIAGSSGSGKSTLTKLLQRLYTPAAGRILIDGVDIAQIDPSWLRRQIGVVLQENLLFNRSIRENIALAHPAMPLEQVMAAAQLAGAHEFIVGLPQGYDTIIEERGVNLSGGQRQRIAIARALVTQPRILILDEATSALDAESEEIIQRNLRAMARGRTVLIIAHRLSAIRQCDRIMTLEKGRIVEVGTHDELLRQGGRYAGLHRRQMGVSEGVA